MAIFRKNTPFGEVIFAEDVRLEAGNKLSFMGVPMGPIGLPQFPSVLPKLVIHLNYWESPGESDEPVVVSLFISGLDEPIVRKEVPIAQLRAQKLIAHKPVPGWDKPIIGIQTMFVLAPLVVPEAGFLRVQGQRGSDQINFGALLFVQADAVAGGNTYADTQPQLRTPLDPA